MNAIFIQIASYRDPELPKTIESALATATYPNRLRFGICRQFHPDDGFDNLDQYRGDFRFAIDDVIYTDSKGCCWARSRVQRLYAGEDFTLQLDAHHRFAEGWDEILIDMLNRCPSEKPIITCYPPIYNALTEERSKDLCEMIPHFMASKCLASFKPSHRVDYGIKKHMCWAGGFMFTFGSFCREVLYDPNLYFIGEEISMAVRSWTRGYDMFLPDTLCVWHEYTPARRVRHWSDHTVKKGAEIGFSTLDDISRKKVTKLLLGEKIEEPFGLGTVRSLDDFENAAGICFKKSMVSMPTRKGAKIPVFDNSEWKQQPNNRYKLYLDWSHLLPDLKEQEPDVVAIFVRERRQDLPCKDGIPTSLIINESWSSLPETFNVWPYKKDPIRWGKKNCVDVGKYEEIEL